MSAYAAVVALAFLVLLCAGAVQLSAALAPGARQVEALAAVVGKASGLLLTVLLGYGLVLAVTP